MAAGWGWCALIWRAFGSSCCTNKALQVWLLFKVKAINFERFFLDIAHKVRYNDTRVKEIVNPSQFTASPLLAGGRTEESNQLINLKGDRQNETERPHPPENAKITVYVPATVDINKEIDNTAQVERVARLLSECFGGATSSPARGYWVAQDGALVAEKTTMVFAYCDTAAAEKYIDDVVTLCNELKHKMGQEAVALEYNGSMYFI